jgi:hypothetical protein
MDAQKLYAQLERDFIKPQFILVRMWAFLARVIA